MSIKLGSKVVSGEQCIQNYAQPTISSNTVTVGGDRNKSVYSLASSQFTGNVTMKLLAPTDLTDNEIYTFEVKWVTTSIRNITFTAASGGTVKPLEGEFPNVQASGTYWLVFRTDDKGNTWYMNSQGRY